MGVRTKTLITVVLVGAVAVGITLTTQNPNLFKGQIFDDQSETVEVETLPPDLTASIKIAETPTTDDGDMVVEVTLENIGEGAMAGGTPFVYAVSINGTEVFSNSDSYSELAPGDAFTFKYPIPKLIYKYPNKGKVSVVVDQNDGIKESNEDNNVATADYNF